jgi:ribosomal protein S12 methylthiotransferase accessory factor YcaO
MRDLEKDVHTLVLSDKATLYLATVFDGEVTGTSIDPCRDLAQAKALSEYTEAVELARIRTPDLEGSYARLSYGSDRLYPHHLLPIDYSRRLFRYNCHDEIGFSSVEDISTGQEVFVPAGFVHPTLRDLRFSTSGAAVGATAEEAIIRASLELYERDAMVAAWLGRTRPVPLDVRHYDGIAGSIHLYFTARGWTVYCFSLPTRLAGCDTVITIGFAPEESQSLVSIGTACSSSLSQAADKAYLELLQIVVVLLNKAVPQEYEITKPIDHLLSYQRPDRKEVLRQRVEEWMEEPNSAILHASSSPPPSLGDIRKGASDLFVKKFPDVDTRGVGVLVKVFSPSLHLLDFGEEVLIGPSTFEPFYHDLKHRWGTATHPFP